MTPLQERVHVIQGGSWGREVTGVTRRDTITGENARDTGRVMGTGGDWGDQA